MLIESLDILRCPVCEGAFYFDEVGTAGATEGTLRCDRGHAFDFAKQGYVNLIPGGHMVHTADDEEMVVSRARYLGRGHYDGLAQRIAELALDSVAGDEPPAGPVHILDAGAGIGFYSGVIAAAAETSPSLVGRVGVISADISKYALRRAAKVHPRVTAIGADTWEGLPVQDSALDAIVCVFAPRNAAEFARTLRPGGVLVLARPTADHMAEVRDSAGLIKIGGKKEEDLERKLTPYFEPTHTERYERVVELSHRDVRDLVMMGPNRHHTTPDKLDGAIAQLPDPAPTTVSVELTVYRRRGAR